MCEIAPMHYTPGNPEQSSFPNMAPKAKKEGLLISYCELNKMWSLQKNVYPMMVRRDRNIETRQLWRLVVRIQQWIEWIKS